MKEINELSLPITEAEVKKGVEDRLTIAQNQGQLMFLRLQSGSLLVKYEERFNKVNLCPEGTADFVIFQGVKHELCFGVTPFDRCKPLPACRVTFLEIKSSKGQQSEEQRIFEVEVGKQNCRYFLVRNADELEGILS